MLFLEQLSLKKTKNATWRIAKGSVLLFMPFPKARGLIPIAIGIFILSSRSFPIFGTGSAEDTRTTLLLYSPAEHLGRTGGIQCSKVYHCAEAY